MNQEQLQTAINETVYVIDASESSKGKLVDHLNKLLAIQLSQFSNKKKQSSEWTENTGVCPVSEGTLIDVKYRMFPERLGIPALGAASEDWKLNNSGTNITHWRLHDGHRD